jgi:hypothetical protein
MRAFLASTARADHRALGNRPSSAIAPLEYSLQQLSPIQAPSSLRRSPLCRSPSQGKDPARASTKRPFSTTRPKESRRNRCSISQRPRRPAGEARGGRMLESMVPTSNEASRDGSDVEMEQSFRSDDEPGLFMPREKHATDCTGRPERRPFAKRRPESRAAPRLWRRAPTLGVTGVGPLVNSPGQGLGRLPEHDTHVRNPSLCPNSPAAPTPGLLADFLLF